MSKRLVICSKHKRYINCLGEHILKRKDIIVQLILCTSVEKLQMLEQEYKIDILLIDEQISYEVRKESRAGLRLVLSQGRCTDLGEEEREIYFYQSAQHIIEQILTGCVERNEGVFREVYLGQKNLIGIYSPVHRIGKTKFAMALGEQLGCEKETLYLNLEEYAGIFTSMKEGQKDLSDLLYYISQEGSSIGMVLASAVYREGHLDILPPIPVSEDLKRVEFEQMKRFLEQLLKETLYKTVVIDFSESVQGLFDLLKLCDTVYMPTIEEPVALKKAEQYLAVLHKTGYEEVRKKTIPITMRREQEGCVKEALRLLKEEAHDSGRAAI